jgi:hypothetical protein
MRPALPIKLTLISASINMIDSRPEDIKPLPILLDLRNNIRQKIQVLLLGSFDETIVMPEITMHYGRIRFKHM